MITLDDELEVIDQTIDELEARRVDLIHRMTAVQQPTGSGKVIRFPGVSVTVRDSGTHEHIW
ncbi:hypothetical protein [Tunturiibacter gelidoferens]|uniref:Uncharacterized protein n=1 Tax=Tunturiibacter gelidiferens TaxID=3069689 RepID=A0A9X0QFS8_9BACT|nr:hypothetical protein [Edaphobacter lichenicola]MBB5329449.1 hypothetical protein [Edaphobacter lichenicola]